MKRLIQEMLSCNSTIANEAKEILEFLGFHCGDSQPAQTIGGWTIGDRLFVRMGNRFRVKANGLEIEGHLSNLIAYDSLSLQPIRIDWDNGDFIDTAIRGDVFAIARNYFSGRFEVTETTFKRAVKLSVCGITVKVAE